jgi:hypothetical protein
VQAILVETARDLCDVRKIVHVKKLENANIAYGRDVVETRDAIIVVRNSEAFAVTVAHRNTGALVSAYKRHRRCYQSINLCQPCASTKYP